MMRVFVVALVFAWSLGDVWLRSVSWRTPICAGCFCVSCLLVSVIWVFLGV